MEIRVLLTEIPAFPTLQRQKVHRSTEKVTGRVRRARSVPSHGVPLEDSPVSPPFISLPAQRLRRPDVRRGSASPFGKLKDGLRPKAVGRTRGEAPKIE